MRHLTVMIGVGAGDRQPDPATFSEAPSGRQQHDNNHFWPARDERGRIAAIVPVIRPACALIRRAGRQLPVQSP
jgi:hypothetical protein